MPDERLQEIFDDLENKAASRCMRTQKWKDAYKDCRQFWELLMAIIPEKFHDILFELEAAANWENAVTGKYIREAIYLYGVHKGIQIAGGICNE